MADAHGGTCTCAVTQVLHRYCDYVDRGPWEEIAPLFVDDAVFDLGESRLHGRAEIAAFYERRSTKAGLVSRHVLTNSVVTISGEEATATSTILLFREVQPTQPVLVGTYHDRLRLTPDGWRFVSKRLEVVFRADLSRAVPATAATSS